MDQLIEHGAVVRGYLGVYITDVSDELARVVRLQGQRRRARAGRLARRPGRQGWPQGRATSSSSATASRSTTWSRSATRSRRRAPGSEATLKVFRSGKEQTLKVKARGAAHRRARRAATATAARRPSAKGGRGIAALRPDARPQAAARDQARCGRGRHRGRTRLAGGTAGLQPGDVIVQIGEDPVKTRERRRRGC